MNPLAYLRVAEMLAGLALIAGICWGVHEFLEHERDIGRNEVRAEYAEKLAEAKAAALTRERELTTQRDTAVNQGQQREQTIRSLADANSRASAGLRDTTASINNGMRSYSIDALRSLASAYGDVFNECQSRRESLATETERLNSEKRTLIEAWPQPQK